MKKFLVVQLARFGDIVQSKRLILALEAQGETTLLTDSTLVPLAQSVYPGVHCLGLQASVSTSQNVWNENRRIFEFLQRENFDRIYSLNYSPLCQVINTLFPPEKLMGYSRFNGFSRQSPWVKMAFRWLSNRKKTPINLVDFWGLLADKPYPADKVNPKAAGKGGGLGIVLSGQNARRSLTPQTYAKIIPIVYNRLQRQNKLQDTAIYFLGTKKEEAYAKELLCHLPNYLAENVNNLAGKTNFTNLQEILLHLELLLSPDTGTIHFAGHLGTPTEGFYLSSANMFETGPYGEGHCVWQANTPCSPCKEFQNCLHTDNSVPECHAGYSHPHFLYHLLHKQFDGKSLENKALQTVIPYFSSFSDKNGFPLFLSWKSPVSLTQDIAREKDRHILENYCAGKKDTQPDLELHNISDNAIYTETDWILPQLHP